MCVEEGERGERYEEAINMFSFVALVNLRLVSQAPLKSTTTLNPKMHTTQVIDCEASPSSMESQARNLPRQILADASNQLTEFSHEGLRQALRRVQGLGSQSLFRCVSRGLGFHENEDPRRPKILNPKRPENNKKNN